MTAMSLRARLLETLEALAPQVIDETRALLELDISASAISSLLSEEQGLALIEYIVEELECGKKPIYSTNRLLQRPTFDQLIEHFYTSGEQTVLDTLLLVYHQFWMVRRQPNDSVNALYETLRKLESSSAVASRATVLCICLDCFSVLAEGSKVCAECGKTNLLEVHSLSLAQPARAVLKNRQYLELYTKECLRSSGVELIGCDFDKHGTKVYTSVRYQIEGEKIDIDVHGISPAPLALLLCEVKTSERVSMNELRRVESLLKRLVDKIRNLSGMEFDYLNLFITTGQFDQNLPTGAYRRKNWELIDRSSVPTLTDNLRRIQREI
jgi:hypothetical protein